MKIDQSSVDHFRPFHSFDYLLTDFRSIIMNNSFFVVVIKFSKKEWFFFNNSNHNEKFPRELFWTKLNEGIVLEKICAKKKIFLHAYLGVMCACIFVVYI